MAAGIDLARRLGLYSRTCERQRTSTRSYRHARASRGAAIPWVAHLMGHANTKMVIQRYWKYIPDGSQQDGGEYLEEVRQAMEGMSGDNRP